MSAASLEGPKKTGITVPKGINSDEAIPLKSPVSAGLLVPEENVLPLKALTKGKMEPVGVIPRNRKNPGSAIPENSTCSPLSETPRNREKS